MRRKVGMEWRGGGMKERGGMEEDMNEELVWKKI
jgi:hypothetical protein